MNAGMNWLLMQGGYRYGLILMWAVRCGESEVLTRKIMNLCTEAALIGKDKSNMRDKLLAIAKELSDLFRGLGSIKITLWKPRYLTWKNKNMTRLENIRYITVARSGNVFVTCSSGVVRVVLELPIVDVSYIIKTSSKDKTVDTEEESMQTAVLHSPQGIAVLEDNPIGKKRCVMLAVVDEMKESGEVVVLHLHNKSITPSGTVDKDLGSKFIARRDWQLNTFFPNAIVLIKKHHTGGDGTGMRWEIALGMKTGGIMVCMLSVKSTSARTEKPHAGGWPSLYSLTLIRVVKDTLLGQPFAMTFANEILYVTDLGTKVKGKDRQNSAHVSGGVRKVVEHSVSTLCDMKRPCGIGFKEDDNVLIVADPYDHVLMSVNPDTGYSDIWAGQSGIDKCVDGVALQSGFSSPVGIAMEVNSVFVVSPTNETLHIITSGEQQADFMDMGREFGEANGIVSYRESKEYKKKIRGISWTESIKQEASIIAMKDEKYEELCRYHGLAITNRSVNGPFGCTDRSVHQMWKQNNQSKKDIKERALLIDRPELINKLVPRKVSQNAVEHLFGDTAASTVTSNRAQTERTMLRTIDKNRYEYLKQQVNLGYPYVTSETPRMYGIVERNGGLQERVLYPLQSSRKEEAEEKKATKQKVPECPEPITQLEKALRAVASSRWRDIYKKGAKYAQDTLIAATDLDRKDLTAEEKDWMIRNRVVIDSDDADDWDGEWAWVCTVQTQSGREVLCEKPDRPGRQIVKCSICDGWWHSQHAGVDEEAARQDDFEFQCRKCAPNPVAEQQDKKTQQQLQVVIENDCLHRNHAGKKRRNQRCVRKMCAACCTSVTADPVDAVPCPVHKAHARLVWYTSRTPSNLVWNVRKHSESY